MGFTSKMYRSLPTLEKIQNFIALILAVEDEVNTRARSVCVDWWRVAQVVAERFNA